MYQNKDEEIRMKRLKRLPDIARSTKLVDNWALSCPNKNDLEKMPSFFSKSHCNHQVCEGRLCLRAEECTEAALPSSKAVPGGMIAKMSLFKQYWLFWSECGTYIKCPVLSGLDGQGHFGPWPGEIGRGKDHLIFTVWPDWSLSSCERCLLHGWQWEPYRRRCGWCWTETWMSTLSSSHLRKKPNST